VAVVYDGRRDVGGTASSLKATASEGGRMSSEKNVSPTKVAAGVVGGAAAALAGSKLVQKVVGEAGKALGADPEQPNRASQTLTISAPADELFGFFRDATNFQRILRNVVEIQPAGERSVHWKVPGPDGHDLELDAELTEERSGELLRWTPGSDGGTAAELEVRLRPSPVGEGTAVTMRLGLESADAAAATPQGALAGALVVKTLYRTKALFETGEVPTLEKNPSARPGEDDRI
jgi:uncharacterized membrane protein